MVDNIEGGDDFESKILALERGENKISVTADEGHRLILDGDFKILEKLTAVFLGDSSTHHDSIDFIVRSTLYGKINSST